MNKKQTGKAVATKASSFLKSIAGKKVKSVTDIAHPPLLFDMLI